MNLPGRLLTFCTILFGLTAGVAPEQVSRPDGTGLVTTPPMGWNSFDSYGVYLYDQAANATLDKMIEILKPSGYEYFVIDAGWFGEFDLYPGTRFAREKHAEKLNIDSFGLLQPSEVCFPDGFGQLIEKCHAAGLKFGLHLMRGIPRRAVELNTRIKGTAYRARDIADTTSICSWCPQNWGVDMDKPGAQEFYNSVIDQMAAWGVDYIKYDDIVPYPREVEAVAKAIEQCGRKIVLSLSPGGKVDPGAIEFFRKGNMLRVTSDVWDSGEDIDKCFAAWRKWQGTERPGFWIDMDMIPFGQLQLLSPEPKDIPGDRPGDRNTDKQVKGLNVGLFAGKGNRRWSELSRDQMYTFITMRAMAASPLMVGGDLLTMDDFSLGLITHRGMIECNQNGVMGHSTHKGDGIEIWNTPRKYGRGGWIGIFNRNANKGATIRPTPVQMGLDVGDKYDLYDIWADEKVDEAFFTIAPGGVVFLKYTAAQRSTSYPLTGIVSVDPRLGQTGFRVGELANPEELNHYRYAHGQSSGSILETVRRYGLTLKPVVYTGGFTASWEIERGYRSAVAMSPNGVLAGALDERQTSLLLDMGDDPEFPFWASTAAGDHTINGDEYCFWVRVDDELMKVTAVAPRAKTITVTRSLDNTPATRHSAGSTVFTPVYLGNRKDPHPVRKKSAWPGTGDVSYALDPASEATHRFKADFVIEKIEEGYSGVWWDTFQAKTFNLCDPAGRAGYGVDGVSIFPWDFKTGAPYTPQSMLAGMKLMTARTRGIVREKTGVEPVLCANNLGPNYNWMSSIIQPGVMLDAFCIEDCFIGTTWDKAAVMDRDSLRTEASPFSFHILKNDDMFIAKLSSLALSASDGRPLIAMTGPAGWVSGHFTEAQPDYHQLERYSWCAYLLTVQAKGANMFGKPITITSGENGKFRVVPLDEMYFYDIGDPVETKPVAEYRIDGHPVYARRFDNGIVIVSRLDRDESYTLELPEIHIDPATGRQVRQVALKGPNGVVLLKKL